MTVEYALRNSRTPTGVSEYRLSNHQHRRGQCISLHVPGVWPSLGFPGGEGPHVAVEGVYRRHEVFVQVLAFAPEGEEPGMKLDAMGQCD